MNRIIAARPLCLLLVACLVGAIFAVIVDGVGLGVESAQAALLLPFVAAAVSVACLAIALPRIDRLAQGVTHHPMTTPYSSLAKTAARIRVGSVEQALPGLAEVLADGTRAQCAVIWLAVEEKLVSAASYPVVEGAKARTTASLAALLALPDVDHVVPVLDGSMLRAALTISKPGLAVTPADQRLMQDVANGAGLLLRGAQLNAELEKRVRRADELATDLQASRQRLTGARDVERRRLIAELTHVTTDRLVALRTELSNAQELLSDDAASAEHAQHAIARARTGLDELLDRFRVIARGVYPTVLRALPTALSTNWRPICADRCAWPEVCPSDWSGRSNRGPTTWRPRRCTGSLAGSAAPHIRPPREPWGTRPRYWPGPARELLAQVGTR